MRKEDTINMYYGYNIRYNPVQNTANSSFNPYQFIILVLIVLQWMLHPSDDPNNLVNNGGLFIITLFGLIFCSCINTPRVVYVPVPVRRRWLF